MEHSLTIIQWFEPKDYSVAIIVEQEAIEKCGPIRHNELPHAHLAAVASGTVARRLRIDVHDDNDDNDNTWQREPLWPHGMGPIKSSPFAMQLTHALWA